MFSAILLSPYSGYYHELVHSLTETSRIWRISTWHVRVGKYTCILMEHDTFILSKMYWIGVPWLLLNVGVYIYIYIYTHIHTYIHTHIHIYKHTYTHTYIHTYIHTYRNYMALKFIKDLLCKWYSFRVLVMKAYLEMELKKTISCLQQEFNHNCLAAQR